MDEGGILTYSYGDSQTPDTWCWADEIDSSLRDSGAEGTTCFPKPHGVALRNTVNKQGL